MSHCHWHGGALHPHHHGCHLGQVDFVVAPMQHLARLAERRLAMYAPRRPGADDLVRGSRPAHARPMRPKLPGRGLWRLLLSGRLGLWPRDGGRLELSGVFGDAPSLASSSATRTVSA